MKCPSVNCFGQMVGIVNGRMAEHDSPMDIALGGQKCPRIGIRVVFDRTQYPEHANPACPAAAGRMMTDDQDAERNAAELDVLTEVIGTLVASTADAVRDGMTDTTRVRLMARVVFALISSARHAAAPHTGRLYAAPVLDPIIDNLPAADEITLLDLLIPAIIGQHITDT
ncbi:hypothetical protein [Nocardia gipuzkoensis]